MENYPGYKKYKQTRCAWLQEIPAHWDFKRLKNVASHNDEALDEQTNPDLEIEYVDISSVSLVNGIEKTEAMLFEKAPSRARRKVKDGDIIVSTVRTYLRAIAPISKPPENMVVSTGFAVVRPKEKLFSGFAGYLLQSNGFVGDVVANSVGVSYPAINASDLVRIPVIEPPLEEQKTIARFLDFKTAQIDSLIARKKTLLEKLAEKRTALIGHAVTKGLDQDAKFIDSGIEWLRKIPANWTTKRLRFLATMSGGLTPSTGKPEYWNGDIPWVTPKDMKRERISTSIDTLTAEALKETSITLHETGRVLIVVRGMILAHTFPVAINTVPSTVNQDMKALSTEMDAEYLALLLKGIQPLILSYVEESGYGTKVLRTDIFKNIRLPNPPLEEQKRIVSKVVSWITKLDYQQRTVEAAIERLREYRSALITNAVTGRIDVRTVGLPTTVKTVAS